MPNEGQQGGVIKFMKNDHFLAVMVIFSKFLGRLKSSFY